MSHDEHFLSRLDRVSMPQVEFALSLYNDAPLVSLVLQDARLPERVPRVALSLDHPERGPFIIVARDGGFVTCLGEGMSPAPHPVVTRAQIDATLHRLADARDRFETAMRLVGRQSRVGALLARIYTAGEFLGREEVHAMGLWQPILRPQFVLLYFDTAETVERLREQLLRVERPRPADRERYRSFWLASWACAPLLVLIAMDGREDMEWTGDAEAALRRLSWWVSSHGVQCFSLRAAWAVARLARVMLPVLKQQFAQSEAVWELDEAVLGLVAIATGRTRLRAEIVKKLDLARPPEDCTDPAPHMRWAIGQTGVEALRDDAATLRAEALESGRWHHHYVSRAEKPDGIYRFATAEEIPEALAFAALFDARWDVNGDYGSVRRTLRLGAAISRLDAEDLYYPKAYHALWARDLNPSVVEDLLRPRRGVVKPAAPVRVAARPGRNDPCSCGSGKKYKKCCGE